MSTFEIVEKDEVEEIAKYLEGLENPADARLIRKMATQLAALKEENERLINAYTDLFNRRAQRVVDLQKKVWEALDRRSCPGVFMEIASAAILEHGCAEIADTKKALEQSQARVAELEHAANEWADACINGLQHLKNIRDGISLASVVIPNMEQCIEHCQSVWAAAIKEPANEG